MTRPVPGYFAKAMRGTCAASALAVMVLGTHAHGDTIDVPSGQPLSFMEFISENDGDIVRFRFLAPEINESFTYADVFPDFKALCDAQVMPVLNANALSPSQIVMSMSAVDIPFGEINPDVLQFFEVFSTENDLCIWEEF